MLETSRWDSNSRLSVCLIHLPRIVWRRLVSHGMLRNFACLVLNSKRPRKVMGLWLLDKYWEFASSRAERLKDCQQPEVSCINQQIRYAVHSRETHSQDGRHTTYQSVSQSVSHRSSYKQQSMHADYVYQYQKGRDVCSLWGNNSSFQSKLFIKW